MTLEMMHERWKKEVAVFVIYIREAHPWPRKTKKKGLTVLPEPRTLQERMERAELCRGRLNLTIPTLIDGMDNNIDRDYAAWPDRIYLVGRNGRIVFKTGPGPFGFDPAGADKAIRKLLKKKSPRMT